MPPHILHFRLQNLRFCRFELLEALHLQLLHFLSILSLDFKLNLLEAGELILQELKGCLDINHLRRLEILVEAPGEGEDGQEVEESLRWHICDGGEVRLERLSEGLDGFFRGVAEVGGGFDVVEDGFLFLVGV